MDRIGFYRFGKQTCYNKNSEPVFHLTIKNVLFVSQKVVKWYLPSRSATPFIYTYTIGTPNLNVSFYDLQIYTLMQDLIKKGF